MADAIPIHVTQEIERFARLRCAMHDAAHDALHLARVVHNARLLHEAEPGSRQRDWSVIAASCWLHDIVQLPKGEGPPGEPARRSAAEARDVLASLGVDQEAIDSVVHAIAVHSFSGGRHPESPEAAIVQDADRLDALGAVGIARLWVTGAELGGALYNADDPSGSRRELDDRAWGLDHIERKLLRLPALMNTAAGRAEAERRAEFLRTYRDAFLSEIGVRVTANDS